VRANPTTAAAFLAAVLLFIGIRLAILSVGAPFISIDDKTAFEGGFLVWFGNAPPQRMYVESWLYGLVCLFVYGGKLLAGASSSGLGADLVADAYRDFLLHPEDYVRAYRLFTLAVDIGTAVLVLRMAIHVLGERWRGWAAVAVGAMFLFSYNLHWSGIVARPDSFLTFCCALGLLLYLLSDAGRKWALLVWSAITLGVATGFKLHGAFLVIFLCIDLLRLHGLSNGLRKAVPFAFIALFFFCVAAGSPLFDPLMYLKLRVANYRDDHSPWITWGSHFITMLRGGGWLALAAAFLGCYFAFARSRDEHPTRDISTIAVVALGWTVLFGITRPLRAYWMLPSLPVFYVLAVYAATRLSPKKIGAVAVPVMLAVLALQVFGQIRDLRSAAYDSLSEWVAKNAASEAFYIVGDDALFLPKNTRCLERTGQVLSRIIERDRADGVPFTLRHMKNWEERSTLNLYDMLGFRQDAGFEYYDYNTTPPETLGDVVDLGTVKYFIVQDGFDLARVPQLGTDPESHFDVVAQATGAGGGAQGLKYRIYARR
jgi:hypothetical protein